AAGGRNMRNGPSVALVESYDPRADLWETPPPALMRATVAPAAVSNPMSTQRTYVIGGTSGLPPGTDGTTVVSRDGNVMGNWIMSPSLGIGRVAPGAAMAGTTILVAGGIGGAPLAPLAS